MCGPVVSSLIPRPSPNFQTLWGEPGNKTKKDPTKYKLSVCTHTSLFRLVLRVQKQVEIKGGNAENNQWKEVVEDLWDNRLSHFQKGVYKDVHTGPHGFQVDSEKDSEDSLMDDLMNEPVPKSRANKEGEGAEQPENDLINEPAVEPRIKEEGERAGQPENEGKY